MMGTVLFTLFGFLWLIMGKYKQECVILIVDFACVVVKFSEIVTKQFSSIE